MRSVAVQLRRRPLLALAALACVLACCASACGSGPTMAASAARGATQRTSTSAASNGGHRRSTITMEPSGTATTVTPTAALPATTSTAPPAPAPQPAPLPPTAGPTTPPPSTTIAAGPGDHGPITSPPLPAPGPGFVEGKVTAIGDSVMLDYETALAQDIPGAQVTAAVGRQWTQGAALLAQLKADGALGAVVIVALGTNGPIDAAQFDQMATILSGASRIVFVNDHVDQAWQDTNNSVLEDGVARTPNAALANWDALATEHPTWLYATQTHLPPGGPGAQALAATVAETA